MDGNIVRILASYGCKYMSTDNKEMIEEIETYVKKREEQLYVPSVPKQRELLIDFSKKIMFGEDWTPPLSYEQIVDDYLNATNT